MRALLVVSVIGCGDASPGPAVDGALAAVDALSSDAPSGPCGAMALVDTGEARFCIDRHEGALEQQLAGGWQAASPYQTVGDRIVRAVPAAAIPPQGYISGDEAQLACERAGKRLCTSIEWLAACRGAEGRAFPYGATHVDGACNDAYPGHPLIDYFGTSEGIWDAMHMNDPGINQQPNTLARGGAYSQCVTPDGVFDLHGNLHEWVADAAGTFRGGFYADASRNGAGCAYATTAHDRAYHDYSTGFRCCSDAP